jgi:hypothetical protein
MNDNPPVFRGPFKTSESSIFILPPDNCPLHPLNVNMISAFFHSADVIRVGGTIEKSPMFVNHWKCAFGNVERARDPI